MHKHKPFLFYCHLVVVLFQFYRKWQSCHATRSCRWLCFLHSTVCSFWLASMHLIKIFLCHVHISYGKDQTSQLWYGIIRHMWNRILCKTDLKSKDSERRENCTEPCFISKESHICSSTMANKPNVVFNLKCKRTVKYMRRL